MYICFRLVVKPFGYAKQTISKHKLSGSPIRVSTFNCIKNIIDCSDGLPFSSVLNLFQAEPITLSW